MADIYKHPRYTAAVWAANNYVLADGEVGVETDGRKGMKIGDGVTGWNSLPYTSAAFCGAHVYNSSGDTGVNWSTGGQRDIWDDSVYDEGGWWSSSVNPSRLTVPSGLGITRVKIDVIIAVTGVTTGNDGFASIRKNGSNLVPNIGERGLASSLNNDIYLCVNSPVIEVSDGDYFEVRTQMEDASVNVPASSSSFAIKAV